MQTNSPKRKEPRYETALVADVFMNKWNPLNKKKAIILDLSWHGYKVEFIKNQKFSVKNGSHLIIRIPINQFNISAAGFLKLELIVKWWDKEHSRAGGIFTHPIGERAIILGNLIQKLAILKQSSDELDIGSNTQLSVENEEAS